MQAIKTLSIFILVTLFLSNSAFAEGEKLREKLKDGTITINTELKGCADDALKYCTNLDLQSQKGFMCLMAYEEVLSPSCKRGILDRAIDFRRKASAIQYSVMSCEADADKFCLDVQPGNGAIINCIKAHEDKVTSACVTALKETGIWDKVNK